ncbi:MAG: hypothetical protein DME64_14490 [Verrucomicrobia bacterium]|nr:MAG: hypothetical protein DME64_14490 [Verrucomicrobiota bacterium]
MCAISSAGTQRAVGVVKSTPDDHFTAGPDCRVTCPFGGYVDDASGCPTICAWIV